MMSGDGTENVLFIYYICRSGNNIYDYVFQETDSGRARSGETGGQQTDDVAAGRGPQQGHVPLQRLRKAPRGRGPQRPAEPAALGPRALRADAPVAARVLQYRPAAHRLAYLLDRGSWSLLLGPGLLLRPTPRLFRAPDLLHDRTLREQRGRLNHVSVISSRCSDS